MVAGVWETEQIATSGNVELTLSLAGLQLTAAQCRTEDEVIDVARDADAMIAQCATSREVPGMAAVIETEGLTKQRGDVVAVSERTLTVETGECYAFIGRNGSGR
ncbi:MAG: hypothetical protein J2P17_08360 [Mycobacterium sp.]|nr:hypothetical protein [Mycobacterium sp.]